MIRRIAIAAAILLAILLVVAGVLWLARAPLAGWAARTLLARQGVAASFEVTRLDTNGATLRNLRLGEGAASVPAVEVDYRLGEALFDRRIRAVRLTRPQVRVRVDEDGISVAGLEVGGGGGGGAPPVSVELISVATGLVTLETPAGELPVELDLEGGPQQGWRGWATAEPGVAAWGGWVSEVERAEAEFEMIGDRLLARAALGLAALDSPFGSAESAELAATVQLSGIEDGFAGASGEGAVNLALDGARSDAPAERADMLIAAEFWSGAPGIGPLAGPLADELAAALSGFDAELAASAAVTPETVELRLEAPARVDSGGGPDLEIRPAEGPAFAYGRGTGAWSARAGLSVTGGPELDLPVLEVDFDEGLSALRAEGRLAPFGDGETMLGGEGLSLDWARTPDGWAAQARGQVSWSGSLGDMIARDVAAATALEARSSGGAIRTRPAEAGGTLTLTAGELDTGSSVLAGVEARAAPVLTVEGGRYRLEPGAAPARFSAETVTAGGSRLTALVLDAPQGGLLLEGEGGAFSLMDGDAPVALSLGAAVGTGWRVRDIRTGRMNAAEGPLVQRTEAGVTFLNAFAGTMAIGAVELESGTAFRTLRLQDVRASGPVSPETELDVATRSVVTLMDTMGRTDLTLETGAADAVISFAPGAPMSARFAVSAADLAGEALPVTIGEARVSGSATFAAPLQAEIGIERAVVAAALDPPPVSPAVLSGDLRSQDGVVTMALSGSAAGAPDGFLQIDLRHNLNTGLGQATASIPQIDFTPRGTQPQDVIAPLRGLVAEVSGPAEAEFFAQWYGNRVETSGRVRLDSVDLATRFGPLEDVTTEFTMSSLAPLLTAEPQLIRLGRFNPGMPLPGGEIKVELQEAQRVRLARAEWPLAGGQISVAPFTWDPLDTRREATLVADRLNLGALVGMFNNEALNASGTVSGRVPLVIEDGVITIDNAVLTGDQEGFISYAGPATDAAAQSNEQANLAFRALENLQYRVLELGVNGPVTGELELTLSVEGFNPDVLDGYPFRFNINLSAELMRLLQDATQGFRIRQQIENSLRQDQDGRE